MNKRVTKMFVARKRAGYTQAQLAAMIGVTQPRISAWESGKAEVPPKRRRQLAQILGVWAEQLTDDAA